MPRTRSFDEAKVLCGAMHAFRRDGYAGVSIKLLEQATGLTSGSLYNAYGDKEGLYRAALEHYVDTFVVERARAYTGPHARLDDLQEYFLSLLREPLADGFGCLVTNAAVEFGSASSVASEGVKKGLEVLASSIRSVLAREIGSDQADLATGRLMLLSQGILVLMRAGHASNRELEEIVRSEFASLRQARTDAVGQGRATGKTDLEG